MLNVVCHFWFCAEINSCPDHSDIFNSSFRKIWLIVVLPKPDPAQTSLFSACFCSWSQGRPQFECSKPLKPPPDMWLAQKTKRNRLSLGHHRKGTRTDIWSLHSAWAYPLGGGAFPSKELRMKPKHIYKSTHVSIHTEELESKRCQELYWYWDCQSPIFYSPVPPNLQETPCWGWVQG